ncbi:MAG: adenylate/guanylate cyclase domain-containing protein [Desulfobacter sp.]
MKRLGNILLLTNLAGACATFFYFHYILPDQSAGPEVPGYYEITFFSGVMLLFLTSFLLFRGRGINLVSAVADGEKTIAECSPESIHYLQRRALRVPMAMSLVSFGMWLLAGFIFGFLEPLVTSRIFLSASPDLLLCLRQFLGISLLGGGVTCLVLFFLLENAWRPKIPLFFPKGRLHRVEYGFRMRLRTRFLVVFAGVVCIPIPVVGILLMTHIRQLHMADAVTRNALISSMFWEMGYVAADLLIIAMILAYLLAKSIILPLEQIKKTVKAVENNDFTRQVPVVANDELGDVAQGVNDMVDSLNESRKAKDSLGRYMCREIREQILAGNAEDLTGEMKRVTLLFSDLRDFTGMVEKNHPRDVVKILNRYFDEMTQAVKVHKGLILQYVGDEIEAVFGAPVGYDDHPEMAVRAALEMRRRLERLNAELSENGFPKLDHGIGIHSGAVLAGNIGSAERMSYALVGDTVNTASRIEGLAKDHNADILLSQTTHDLLTGAYNMSQLPPVRVKGKDKEVIVYKLNA